MCNGKAQVVAKSREILTVGPFQSFDCHFHFFVLFVIWKINDDNDDGDRRLT